MTESSFSPEHIDSARGERYIGGAEVRLGEELSAQLFSITERPVDASSLVEGAKDGIEDRSLSAAEEDVMRAYGEEHWLKTEVGGQEFVFPMAPLLGTEYFNDPQRVESMQVVLGEPFEIHPALRDFRDTLVNQQLATGRNLRNGAITSVAGYDPVANRMTLRQVGYYDVFATSIYGADVPFDQELHLDGLSGGNIRELAGLGKLPELSQDSLVTNSFGLGGIVESGDGKLLLARRRGNLGVASASGTFGYTAAGNLDWNDALRESLDTMPAHEALVRHGIGVEAQEELNMGSRFRNPRDLFATGMERLAYSELGLGSHEVTITPIGTARDATHLGLPQTSYFLSTPLEAHEVVRRMVTSPDARKEYDMVLAFDKDEATLRGLLANKAQVHGVNINVETRSTLALMLAQESGRKLLSQAA
jgi:hypothetical protein